MASVPRKLDRMSSSRITGRELISQIFDSDFPEQFVRGVPAQSIYCIVKEQGIESSSELIEITTVEQCRIMLDLDCWEKWSFREDSVWEWLSLSDDADGLKVLQKVLRSIDLKLVALLVARHVETVTFEEPTDNPPKPGSYTPDKGSTWIYITIEDGTKHFLLGRLLAMLFESDAELFYRILSIAVNTTGSALEEEAFLERNKRLASEGIPELEIANEVNSPFPEAQALSELRNSRRHSTIIDILPVHPLIYDTEVLQPLESLFNELGVREELENELTFIINSAIVRWSVQFHQPDEIKQLVQKVKGAINIGLEHANTAGGAGLLQSFEALGLQKLYRLGLDKLMHYKRLAAKMKRAADEAGVIEPELEAVLATADEAFPAMPRFLKVNLEKIDPEAEPALNSPVASSPIQTLKELSTLVEFLNAHKNI